MIGDDAPYNARPTMGFVWENELLPLSHQAMASFSPLIYRSEPMGVLQNSQPGDDGQHTVVYALVLQTASRKLRNPLTPKNMPTCKLGILSSL